MPAPDPDFTRYIANSDEAAFRALVAAHLGMVLGVAARKLGPHAHLAPDVAQAVFTRLARVARGLPRDLIVAPWLHRQAVRLACDAVRKEERRLRRETTAAMLHAPDSSPPPAETALLLDEALDHLPAADRTVLVLRYLEARDFESVAQSLGSTPEAARKRIARSLEKLRALLTRRGVALTAAGLSGFLSTLSTQAAAPAALSARISASALKSAAATGNTAAILTTALMSHATALTTGALAALLACGLFYQQREKEIGRSALAAQSASSAVSFGSDRSALSDQSGPTSAPLPSTLPEIIAAIALLTDGPDTSTAHERITALLRRVMPEQYLEFYISAEPRVHPMWWQAVIEQSSLEWKRVEPALLTKALFESDGRKEKLLAEAAVFDSIVLNSIECRGRGFTPRIGAAFQEWLSQDTGSAWEWLNKVENTPLMRLWDGRLFSHLRRGAAAAIASQKEPLAVDLSEFGPAEIHDIANRWAHVLFAKPDDFSAVMKSLPGDSVTASSLAHAYAASHPVECEHWIRSQPPGNLRFNAALSFVEQCVNLRGESGRTPWVAVRMERARLALESTDVEPPSEALPAITTSWLKGYDKNSEELLAWLLKQDGDSAEAIVAGSKFMASRWNRSPEALTWAAAIPDAAQRSPLLRGIYLRWQDADPAAAQKFLTTAPAAVAAELRALTPEAP